jgi:1-deoxy-D-xylulose 5-phosphate reductoisomerase
LADEIGFMDIPAIIESIMDQSTFIASPSIDDYGMDDARSRTSVTELVRTKSL